MLVWREDQKICHKIVSLAFFFWLQFPQYNIFILDKRITDIIRTPQDLELLLGDTMSQSLSLYKLCIISLRKSMSIRLPIPLLNIIVEKSEQQKVTRTKIIEAILINHFSKEGK